MHIGGFQLKDGIIVGADDGGYGGYVEDRGYDDYSGLGGDKGPSDYEGHLGYDGLGNYGHLSHGPGGYGRYDHVGHDGSLIIGDSFGGYPHQIVRKVITAPSHDIIGSSLEGEGEVIVLEAGHELSPKDSLAHDQPVDVSYSLDSFDHN